MTKRFPIRSLLFVSISAAMAGCTIDIGDPTSNSPVIHLNGESDMALTVGDAYIEPGYQALDVEDGDITVDVVSNSTTVDTQVAGEYEITYRVSDSDNMESAPVTRRVTVVAEAGSNTEQVVGGTTEEHAEEDAAVSEYALSGSDTAAAVPEISSFQLLAYTPERAKFPISEISNGMSFDLSLMPTNLLNIEAVSANASKTGSVHFVLDGPVSIDRHENWAIYTMQSELEQLNIDNGALPVGNYSLAVTPYSRVNKGGIQGLTQTVTFKVVDSRLETPLVPPILAAELVAVDDTNGEMSTLATITEGYTLDLSQVPSARVNVVAVSEDAANTGSVHFILDGPTSIDRHEDYAPFTMAEEKSSLNIAENDLSNGEYTLIITPYTEKGLGGDAGLPLMINFSVTGSASVGGSSSPGVTEPGETVTLIANSDSYSFDVSSGEQPGMTIPVSANDELDQTSAQFTVVSQPMYGTVQMFDLGFFEYTPAPGHPGSDSFTYQVSQNGTTATANASISVYDPRSERGFTAISPSPDSKLIYVSSSEGSDANTCLAPSAPCKSISAAMEKMRGGYPDHVYLKRGDVWRGQAISSVQSGRSASEPAVVAFYGESGSRPRLEGDTPLFSVSKRALSKKHLNVIGLHFYAYKMDPKHPDFTGTHHANIKLLTDNENILFEDNIFNFLEVVLQGWDGGNPKDFTFRRNIWTGSYYNKSSYDRNSRPSNMYANNVDGLVIEENVIDRGGWNPDVAGAGANMFNHNLYLQYDNVGNSVVVRNNIITRASSHGVQIRAGGLVENNFFAKNAIAASIGYFNQPLQLGTFARVHRNVITEGHSMIKGQDACQGVNLCTTAVYGTSGNDYGEGDISARDNIVHSLAADDTLWQSGGFYDKYNKLAISAYKLGDAVQTNNISWKWDDAGTKTDGKTYPDPGRTLADYNAYLGGRKDFSAFMDTVLTRPLQTWDERYSANSINNYVREGFGQK